MYQVAKQEWTAEETETLIRLLGKVKTDDGWWPTEECMRAAHGAMFAWASELIITKMDKGNTREILLTLYEGGMEEFSGMWHIPGGYGSIMDESIHAACSRIAKRELGVNVWFLCALEQPDLWRTGEHPYGRPLSLYCWVYPLGEIAATDHCKFFDLRNLPDNTVPVHREFLRRDPLRQLKR